MSAGDDGTGFDAGRRHWLGGTVACAAMLSAALAEGASPDPSRMPPQKGDVLVFPPEQNAGRAITASDLVAGAAPLLAYPRDPSSGALRARSRLNQILLLKLDPAKLDRIAARHALDGVLAFSGVCTHAACGVSSWKAETSRLVCPCHGSEFDPAAHATATAGPAPRALPILPLALQGEHFIVAGAFTGKVGVKKP
ncbi:MAG: Rieske (2Fe-2S) protein [Gammaproteobacteria bacterium]|nr:Rieske (2Fe-2S) protein [Gammaproteobacteria bacterium]